MNQYYYKTKLAARNVTSFLAANFVSMYKGILQNSN